MFIQVYVGLNSGLQVQEAVCVPRRLKSRSVWFLTLSMLRLSYLVWKQQTSYCGFIGVWEQSNETSASMQIKKYICSAK
jgi:hypothetical protein